MTKVRLTSIWPENNGTVFAGRYNVDSGYDIFRPRGTDDWQILATTAGVGRIGSVNGEFMTVPGELLMMRPGIRHDYGPQETGWEYTWIHFQPRQEWLEWLGWPEHAPGLRRLRLEDMTIRAHVMNAMARTLAAYPSHRRQLFAMNALEEVLLWCDLQNPLRRHLSADPRVTHIMTYLSENLASKTTLAALAAMVNVSVSHLSHIFHQQIGMGPVKYLDIQRLEHARWLLENTDAPVTTIASTVGFELRYFSLHFKHYTTLSPRAYRNRASGAPSTRLPKIP